MALSDEAPVPARDVPQDGVALAHGAAANFLTLAAANLRGLFTFLIARLLGEAALGTFSLAYANTDLASKLGVFGLDNATIALVARRQAEGDRRASRAILRWAVAFGIGASLVTLVVGAAVALSLGNRLGQPASLRGATALMLLALPGIALYRIANGVSRGHRVMRHDLYSRGLAETWTTLAVFVAAYLAGLGPLAAVIAVIAGATVGGLVAWRLAWGLGRPEASDSGCGAPVVGRDILAFSAPIAGYGLLNLLIQRLDVVLLGLFVGRAPGLTLVSFGVFCAAVEVAGGLRKVRQVFDPILAPVVAARIAQGHPAEVVGALGPVGRWVLATQLPLVGLLVLSGGLILSVFGPGFRSGGLILLILGLAHGTSAFVGLAETVLMVERPVLNLVNSCVTLVLQTLLSLVLIPSLGALGAALAMLTAYTLQGLLRFAELRLVIGVAWPWASLRRPALAFALAILPGLLVRLLWPEAGPWGELAAGLVFLTAYALGWTIMGFDPDDRSILRAAFGRRPAAGTTTS